MVGRDEVHSSSLPNGPATPLRRAWFADSGRSSSFTTWPVTRNGIVYASSGPGLLAVSAETGQRRWFVTPTEGQNQVSPSVGGSHLWLPLPGGRVAAFDLETGTESWKKTFGEGSSLDPSITQAGELLFFGLAEDRLFLCVRALDGSVVWRIPTELLPTSLSAVADGVVVLGVEDVETPRVTYHALGIEDGSELWRVDQRESSSSPSIFEGKVVFGGGDFFAHALDLKTGKEIWKSSVEGKFDPRNMPAIAFGDVFLADRIGNIYRLDGETGKRKWIFRDTEGTMDQSFPVIAGKTLFIGSSAGNLYALDTDSGRLLWQDHVEGIVLSGAADSERFYFGVKFGDEGLYAYEHDPEGELEPSPDTSQRLRALIGGLVLFGLIFIGVVLYSRRRRREASESAA